MEEKPAKDSSAKTNKGEDGIRIAYKGGGYEIPCVVNGLEMKCCLDTHAESVCISPAAVSLLYEKGYLESTGPAASLNRKVEEGVEIKLRYLKIGELFVPDVKALVVSGLNTPILVGLSTIRKYGKAEIKGDFLVLAPKDRERTALLEYGRSHKQTVKRMQLAETTWKECSVATEEAYTTIAFSRTRMTNTYHNKLRKKTLANVFDYYLSDEVPLAFDKSKVGESSGGSYIVYYNDKRNKMDTYKIVSLSDGKLVLFRSHHPDEIGGSDGVIMYEQVK